MTIWFLLGLAAGLAVAAPVSVVVLRRSNERARRAERRQQEAERLAHLGFLTGGLAHEIKNPLSTIGLNAQLICEAVAELPISQAERGRLTHRADALRREAERLRDILDDFLRFAGAMKIEPTPVDLNRVAEELVDFFAPQAATHGVLLRLETATHPVVALADEKHLKQAALNLMLNAVQVMAGQDHATPGKRELILRTERGSGHGDAVDGPVAILHVIDTGPGIPAGRLNAIFNPYVSMRSGGAGLGLAITRRIMAEHGGRIEAHSEPGKGSDFALLLPAANSDS